MWKTVYIDHIYLISPLTGIAKAIIAAIVLLVIAFIAFDHKKRGFITLLDLLLIVFAISLSVAIIHQDVTRTEGINFDYCVSEEDADIIIEGEGTVHNDPWGSIPGGKTLIINGKNLGFSYSMTNMPPLSSGDYYCRVYIKQYKDYNEVMRIDIWEEQ